MYGINSPKTFNFSAFRYVAIQKKVIRNSLNNTVTGTNVLMSYCIQHYCPDLSRFNISRCPIYRKDWKVLSSINAKGLGQKKSGRTE